MKILVDVDEVVIDTHVGWLRKYNADYDDHLTPADITRWAMDEIVKPECGKKIYLYLANPDLYDMCPEIDGARKGVEALRALNHEIVFVSSGFFPAKVEWLFSHGFSISEYWYWASDIVLSHDKRNIVGDVLIDDYEENLLGFKFPILFDQPWNQAAKVERRAHGWSEVVKFVWNLGTYNVKQLSDIGY